MKILSILVIYLIGSSHCESTNEDDGRIANHIAPSISVFEATVIPKEEVETGNRPKIRGLDILIDECWKQAVLIIIAVILSLTFCYVSRCCYLVWDCCTDSYWGCCPRRQGCKRFMLLQCCDADHKGVENQYEYHVCQRGADCSIIDSEATQQIRNESSESSEIDCTLRHVEEVIGDHFQEDQDVDRWQDTSRSIMASMKRQGSKRSLKRDDFSTSTPKKSSLKAEVRNSQYADVPKSCDVAEAMPQLHDDHYFNVLNVFGIGRNKYEYSVANHRSNSNGGVIHDSNKKTKKNSENLRESLESSRCVSPSDKYPVAQTNKDFLLSNSFSNVSYQRYGLHIEEGRRGKYQPLPEAQSQLLPPDKFMLLQRDYPLGNYTSHAQKKALMASRRRSRSMETFTKIHRENNGESNRREVNNLLVRSSTRSHTDVTMHHRIERNTEENNQNASGTESINVQSNSMPIYSVPKKKKSSTKSQDQNGVSSNPLDGSEAPLLGKPPSGHSEVLSGSSIPRRSHHHKRKRGGKHVIDLDIQNHILYGKETTL